MPAKPNTKRYNDFPILNLYKVNEIKWDILQQDGKIKKMYITLQ